MKSTVLTISACAAATIVGSYFHAFHTHGDFFALTHVFLTLIAVVFYIRSGKILFSVFNKAQTTLVQFKLSGWFSIFNDRYVNAGPYVLRLAISVNLMMIVLNIWHLFTFGTETAPDIKNNSWRIAHVMLAAMLIFIAKDYRKRIENHDLS